MVILSAMKLSNTSPLEEIGNQVEDKITFILTIQLHNTGSCENNNTILYLYLSGGMINNNKVGPGKKAIPLILSYFCHSHHNCIYLGFKEKIMFNFRFYKKKNFHNPALVIFPTFPTTQGQKTIFLLPQESSQSACQKKMSSL